jgi:hypothetical protein
VAAKLPIVKAGLTDFGDDALRKADGATPAAVVAWVKLFVHKAEFCVRYLPWMILGHLLCGKPDLRFDSPFISDR